LLFDPAPHYITSPIVKPENLGSAPDPQLSAIFASTGLLATNLPLLPPPPFDEPPGADLGLFRPAPDEIHELVPRMVRNPDTAQSAPSFFLGPHAPPSTQPEPHRSGSSSPGRQSAVGRLSGCMALLLEGGRAVFEKLLVPAIEGRGLQAKFIAELRDRLLLQQMPRQDGDFSSGA
jgi:hypothetical protein